MEEGLETQAEKGDSSETLEKVTASSSTGDRLDTCTLALSASEHSQVTKAEGRTLQAEEMGTVAGDVPAELSCNMQQELDEDSQALPTQSKGDTFTAPVGIGDGACTALENQPCRGSFLGKRSLVVESETIPEMPSEEQKETKLSSDEGCSFHLMLSQELSLCQENMAAKQMAPAAASVRAPSQNLSPVTQNVEGFRKGSLKEAEAAQGAQGVFPGAPPPQVLKGCDSQPQPDINDKKCYRHPALPVLKQPAGLSAGGSSEESSAEGAEESKSSAEGAEEGMGCAKGAEESKGLLLGMMRARPGRVPEESPAGGESTAVPESQLTPERNPPLPGKGEEVLITTPQQRACSADSESYVETQQEESGVPEEGKRLQEKSSDVPAGLPAAGK